MVKGKRDVLDLRITILDLVEDSKEKRDVFEM